jgi:hypothetical protein
MRPHSDRRDRAESSCVEPEERRTKRQHDIVSELVLRDDLKDRYGRPLRVAPPEQRRQRVRRGEQLGGSSGTDVVGGTDDANRDRSHEKSYETLSVEVSR